MENNPHIVKYLMDNIPPRVCRYFPDLSKHLSIKILDQRHRLIRKNSVLYEISVVDHSRQTTRGIFVKLPKDLSKRAVKNLYRHLVDVYNFSTSLPEELNVARPLDYLPEIGAIVTERVDGEELKQLLRTGQGSPDQNEILKNCGRFLRAYHEKLGQITWQTDYREPYLKELRESLRLLKANGVGSNKVQEILVESQKAAGRLEAGVPFCLTEKDYRHGNIIAQGSRIFLIEVNDPVHRPVYEDLAKFLNNLTTLYLGTPWFLLGQATPLILREEFLKGYFMGRIPVDFVSLFCAKHLCYRWYRALELSFPRRAKRSRFLMPWAIYRHRINRFFQRNILAQLEIARKSYGNLTQSEVPRQFRAQDSIPLAANDEPVAQ